MSFGVLAIIFGLLSPALTQIMLATPEAYILALGGIAMLPSLQAAFVTSLRTKYTWGALITFVITVSGLSILNIGSAFWGLVIGYACSSASRAGRLSRRACGGLRRLSERCDSMAGKHRTEGVIMASEGLHEENLSDEAKDLHRAIVSTMEELEAVDWYNQRAEATTDPELKKIMEHNRDEELEHAAMLIEWLRRKNEKFDEEINTYINTEGSIVEAEEEATES